MSDKKGKRTSFKFTEQAKSNLDNFRTISSLTQPEIINRVLESVDEEFVLACCGDLIEAKKIKMARDQQHEERIARIRKVDPEKLDQFLATVEQGV